MASHSFTMSSAAAYRAPGFDTSFNSSASSLNSAPDYGTTSYYGSHSFSPVRSSAALGSQSSPQPARQTMASLYQTRPTAWRPAEYAPSTSSYASPFAVRDVSPAERRRLVSELRMDAHRQRTRGLARQVDESRLNRSHDDVFTARVLRDSFSARVIEDARGNGHRYAVRPVHRYAPREQVRDGVGDGASAEDKVQRGLDDLERSTETLRRMGTELASLAASISKVAPKQPAASAAEPQAVPSPVLPRGNAAAPAYNDDSRTMDFSNLNASSILDAPSAPVADPPSAPVASAPAAAADDAPAEQPVTAVPPAHVDLSDLEQERARRKKEFLAKRQVSNASAAFASTESNTESDSATGPPPVAAAAPPTAAAPAQDDHERRRREFRDKQRLAEQSGPITFAPPPTMSRLQSIDDNSSTMQSSDDSPTYRAPLPPRADVVKRGVVFEQQAEEEKAADDAAAEQGEEDDDRAAKFERMAMQAALLKAGGKSFAMVPFGTFLQEQVGKHASYDDADLARSTSLRQQRPPPLLPSDMRRGKVKRASSMDQIYTMKDVGAGSAGSDGAAAKPTLKKQPVLKEGFLFKSSGAKMFSGIKWRRRWFVLSGRLLVYTSSPRSNEVGRMFDLNHIEVVSDPRKLGKTVTPHAIGIQDHTRRIILCADTHAEVLEWYQAIVLNVALLCAESRQRPITSLPPKDRSEVSAIEAWRKEMIAKHKAVLPMPPPPQDVWFYPHYKPPPSHYDVLGVPSDASSSAIKKAYFRLARESHPDRNPSVTQEDFSKIAFAYDALIDPTKRANFDLSERIKENLRQGIDLWMHEAVWDDADLAQEPRLRPFRRAKRKRTTLFSDGDLHILYWQDAPEDPDAAPLPLRPSAERCIEMRFVQQVLHARDFSDAVEMFGKQLSYEDEFRLVLLGDRLITGPLVFEMSSPVECKDLITGLRVSRCERSALFLQKLEALQKAGIQ